MGEPVTSVRATVRVWRHAGRSQEAFERAGWVGFAPMEAPETMETVTRVWLAGGRVREETEDGQVSVSREDDGRYSQFRWLGRTSLADDVFIDLGIPAGDEIVVERDAERGTPRRIEARYAGEPYVIFEVLEIAFDETFPDDVFTPPPGSEVGVRGLTLEQVAASAPFALWVPAEDWECTIAYVWLDDDPSIAPQVNLQYTATATRIAQSPVSHPGQQARIVLEGAGPWRDTERNGRHMEVREHAEGPRPAQVCLELEGTWIEIHSWELDINALADLAGGLRRAS